MADKKLFIPIIQGTNRKDRKSIYVSRLIAKVGAEIDGVETVLVDPNDLKLPYDGNDETSKDPRYTEITQKADAFFVVVPEYNHSFPASLKRILDSELQNYLHKPVAMAGVSAGPWGGIRGIQSLIPALREMGLVVTHTDVQFPGVQSLFDEAGELTDKKYIERVKRSFIELIWMARALRWGRENLS